MFYTRRLLIGIALLMVHQARAQYNRACYWQNGTVTTATNNTFGACYAQGDSHCCDEGEACLSNGLCFGAKIGVMYVGACTNSKWSNSAACPTYCEGSTADAVSDGRWQNVRNNYNGTISCVDTSMRYTYPPGDVLLVVNTTGTTTTSSSVASTTSTGGTATAPACTNSTALPSKQKDMVSEGVPIGVGVGLGVGLGALAVALGVLYGRERRLRKAVEKDLAARPNRGYDSKENGIHFEQEQMLPSPKPYVPYKPSPVEMDARRDPHEMGG